MQISILWNVSILLKSSDKLLIFSGFRDRTCEPEAIISMMKEMTDELIMDLDGDLKNAFNKLGYAPQTLMEMKKVEIK